MYLRLAAVTAVLLASAACADEDSGPPTCHFASGRPCPAGVVCLGAQGNECNYYTCDADGALVGTAIACMPGTIPASGAGPHDCDPTHVTVGVGTPPPAPCPLGGLYTIENGFYRTCVPVAECRPLPCDPAFAGDGCPSNHTCDAATHTCVAALTR